MNRVRLGTWLAGLGLGRLGFRTAQKAPTAPPLQVSVDYAGLMRQEVYDWLCEDTDGPHPLDALRPAHGETTTGTRVSIELGLWVDTLGAVTQATISGSNDIKTLASLKALLLACRISTLPPDDLRQPVRLRLTLAPPDDQDNDEDASVEPDAGLSLLHQG